MSDEVPSYMVPSDFTTNEKIELGDIEDVIPKPHKFIDNQKKMRKFVTKLMASEFNDTKDIKFLRQKLRKEFKIQPSNPNILYTYRTMLADGEIDSDPRIEQFFRGKNFRANSGVMVITVVASPNPNGQAFSCKFNCYYCPNEPAHEGNGFQAQPRSYIFNEPGVRRANRNKFDAILQFRDRIKAYLANGLPIDKIELIILGGTWHSFPKKYRYEFIRDLFYAANTLWDKDFNNNPREKLSIEEEHRLNENAKCRIIGLTIETRPDQITPDALIEMRWLGVTRVQLGVQHTDDKILKIINRQCPTKITIRAIKMLKDCGFKVDIHLMPDLPGSSYEKDKKMFERILYTPDLQADQWKIYPCMTIPWTKIKEWYDKGTYKPYAESIVEMEIDGKKKMVNPLFELIIYVKSIVHPWIRLNRVIRDIPEIYMVNLDSIDGCGSFSNMRQVLQNELHVRGKKCRCIRCREVKGKKTDLSNAQLFVKKYDASDGIEYYLSYESPDQNHLYGFLRLRLSNNAGFISKRGFRNRYEMVFPELVGTAMIRELHVYGSVVQVNRNRGNNVQHYGFGTRLLKEAERIAFANGFDDISVISGIGVKPYYRKRGYDDEGYYLTKSLFTLRNFLTTTRGLRIVFLVIIIIMIFIFTD